MGKGDAKTHLKVRMADCMAERLFVFYLQATIKNASDSSILLNGNAASAWTTASYPDLTCLPSSAISPQASCSSRDLLRSVHPHQPIKDKSHNPDCIQRHPTKVIDSSQSP